MQFLLPLKGMRGRQISRNMFMQKPVTMSEWNVLGFGRLICLLAVRAFKRTKA